MVVNLACLLVMYGHKPDEITILSAYNGQAGLIRKKIDEAKSSFSELLTDDNTIRVSTIDNYQGDENEIVIVSLVRGNSEGSVGFLNQIPRRCVAQSRAKACVIFVGNAETIRAARCWSVLMDNVDMVSSELKLVCPIHPEVSSKILKDCADASRLLEKPDSLCRIQCPKLFPCELPSHACKESCQPEHEHTKCMSLVPFTFQLCSHQSLRECYKKESEMICEELVSFNLACGHSKTRYLIYA